MAIAWKNYLRRPGPRTGIAVLAGLLWTVAFPLFEFPIAAWIAPGCLLFCGMGVSPGHAARLGYIAGFTHFVTSLYWLLHIPFPVGNVAAWISLSAFCALYPCAWMWLCWRSCPGSRPDPHPSTGSSIRPSAAGFSADYRAVGHALFDRPWLRRQGWFLFCALSWTALEFTRGWFLTGFPWNYVGASQFRLLPLIQVSEFTGVLGVSFFVLWSSVTIVAASLLVMLKPQARFAWKNELAVSLLVMLGVVSWGVTLTMTVPEAPNRVLKLAMVQPSIPQTLIFDEGESTNRFRQIMELSRAALETNPDVLVWPEASLPASLSQEFFEEIMQMVNNSATPIIFGSLDVDVVERDGEQVYESYNAAFLFDEHASHRATYRKQRLVIFGEYTPFARHIPFLAELFPSGVGFGSGENAEPFVLRDPLARIAVNICFEDNFADVVRDQVQADTDFVLNLTNNGWFSESAAQWQHAANAVFRAVENRVPLVRVTNNGLSCWIDEMGRLRGVFTDDDGSVYGSGFQSVEIPLLDAGQQRTATFYHARGDWLGWLCTATTLVGLVLGIRTSRRA